jgi:tetratricopeptide (TPR) repeat protein
VGVFAGCTGAQDGLDGGTPTSTADEHIEAAAQSYQTAIDEFRRYTGSLQQSGLQYSSETVDIALEDARESLEQARGANPTDVQGTQMEYLAAVADAVEASADGYGSLLSADEHVDLALSYQSADRREETRDEIVAAEDAYLQATEQLATGLEAVRAALDIDVELETELRLVEWRQRLQQSHKTAIASTPAMEGFRHESEGRWAYNDGVTHISEENYDDAVERFSASFQAFGGALDDYRAAESNAPPDYRQQLIERTCVIEGYYDAAEDAHAAATLYDDGEFEKGVERFDQADQHLNRDC